MENGPHQEIKPEQKPWSYSWEEVTGDLQVAPDDGLSSKEIRSRRRRFGPNRLHAKDRRSAWAILVGQIKNLIILLLAVATAVSFAFAQWLEGVAIAIAIFLNVAFGFFTELRATRSMEALQRMSRVTARVRRGAENNLAPSEKLVPGDIVEIEGGDIVPADMRLVEASRLKVDESPLTGESVPVEKQIEKIDADASLAERSNMLFKGTAVAAGSGLGVVTATGMDTELGRIASLSEAAEAEETPLEKRLNRLGYRLVWLTLSIAGVVIISGIVAGKELFLMIETAIALAVAAAPEGLPVVATIALARGMWRMLRHNALINRLSAVETLGSTTVICTDKTGTLTQNSMTMTRILVGAERSGIVTFELKDSDGDKKFVQDRDPVQSNNAEQLAEILKAGVLCSNASLKKESADAAAAGDPMELAILEAARTIELERDRLLETLPEVREEAFDRSVKMMATFHEQNGSFRIAVKGAPEAVLSACTKIRSADGEGKLEDDLRETWLEQNRKLARDGQRILAAATKTCDSQEANPYQDLVFLGLFGMQDPVRDKVASAIGDCRQAGIDIVMVTGDQPETARSIGREAGLLSDAENQIVEGDRLEDSDDLSDNRRRELLETKIFSRVTPEQKLNLIKLHQRANQVVAMTGDGVNDAPALKKADIGIAMGQRGTQVAQEAADMILKDDAFNTIVTAIQQGRTIFENVRKFILYLLSGNVGEILIVAVAILAGWPLPLLPLQILYLNMIGDVFPALALAVGGGDPLSMRQPPRAPKEPILTRSHWFAIGGYGVLITVCVLSAYALAFRWLGADTDRAVTVSFITLAFARLWHVFNMRAPGTSLIRNSITTNPFIWVAIILCVGLLLIGTHAPGLALVLNMVDLGTDGWMLIIGFSLLPLIFGQILKAAHQAVKSQKE
ncbi:MAG: cation-transporting P-type ATPase [Desulfobacterales bacterium]|jgi:Ca2+-transporting ATPase